MALGLIRPTSGEVGLFGSQVTDRDALSPAGSLVDGGTFYPFQSGRDNLRVLARTRGIDGRRIEEMLERVDLSCAEKREFKGYSIGIKQRFGTPLVRFLGSIPVFKTISYQSFISGSI